MTIPSIKQKLFNFLFYKSVAIKIQFFNSSSGRVFPSGEGQRSPPPHNIYPAISKWGGLDRTSTFKGGLLGKKRITFFKGGEGGHF